MPGLQTHFLPFLIHRPSHTHTHTQPARQSVVKDISPKINKPLFKSCKNIKLIFIISAYSSVARKYLSFICLWITMHYTVMCIHRLYVFGRFLCLCVCVLWSDMHLCALQCWQEQKESPSKAQKLLSVCGHTSFGAYVCVAFRTQRTWTLCQNLNAFSYTSCYIGEEEMCVRVWWKGDGE